MSVANRETRQVIFGLEGTSLTAEEGSFFRENRPWGIILFARNIETREQLCALTDDLREKSGNAPADHHHFGIKPNPHAFILGLW